MMRAKFWISFSRRMLQPCTIALPLLLLFPVLTWSKDVPVSGIFLYDGSSGPAYVQVTGILFNGKTELRVCAGSGSIDKNAYKKLAKISLGGISSLQRRADGALMATMGVTPAVCVVPGNFKFEGDAALSPSDLVDKSAFSGTPLGSKPDGVKVLPPFSPKSELVLGSATERERAEFLLAQRTGTIDALRGYLSSYAGSPDASKARVQLALLLDAEGSARMAAYRQSKASSSPAFDALSAARKDAMQSLEAQPGDVAATQLSADVQSEMDALVKQASADLQTYSDALSTHKDGYGKLVEAQKLTAGMSLVDPSYPAGVTLGSNVRTQASAHNAAIQTAEADLKVSNVDAALVAITPYRSFDGDDPGVSHVIDGIYKYHFDLATAALGQENWAEANKQFQEAFAVRATAEAKEKIAASGANLLTATNKATADKAIAASRDLADSDPIRAYELLADLPDGPRALVKDQMSALEKPYVLAATASAKQLEERHRPIHGLEDENAVRRAYDYYARSAALSNDEDIRIKQELLAEMISTYYISLGEKYLSKPLSSGVGIGWAYLAEAQQYRPNIDQVRDDMTKNGAAYQMRSRLSIGVLFRDQTSRRDSAGFTDQMQQAFATGIETSGLPAKVILPGPANTLEPNFQFVGEILQHRTIRTVKKDTLRSEYRSGSREVPNDAWNRADLDFEAANMELQKYQAAANTAQSKGNKKQIEAAAALLIEQERRVQQARATMNAFPRTLSEPILSPYNYTQTTLELTNIVELSFRIQDSSGSLIQPPTRVLKGEKPRKFILLDNIKADDTKGIKEIDSPPDETQLMTDVEIEARDTMVKAAHDQVLELPAKVLAQARAKEASGDRDGAGELYILYLNSTPPEMTPERQAAVRFVSSAFNLRHATTLSASIK